MGWNSDNGPSTEDYLAAGWTIQDKGSDNERLVPRKGWVRDPRAPMGYAPPSADPILNVARGMTAEQLQELTKQAPITKPRWVEGGEGGHFTYDFYDPASQARTLLAQPERVTAEYIAQNFPSFAGLPKATLQAMGNDWRNAYGQLLKFSAPENLPEGYVSAVTRNEGGTPFVSFGGPTEMLAEATPYISYDPKYGLVVPQAGIRPADKKRSALDIVGSVAPGIALSALLGPAGFGLSLPAAGAVSGGFNALMNDGNVLKGALTGGALGGFGQLASPVIGSAVGAAGLTGAAADAVSAGALAAGKAALTGGDPLQAALMAAAGSAASSATSTLDLVKSLDPGVAKALTAAASGAAKAAVGGVDPVTAALESAFKSGAGSAWSSLTGPAGSSGTPAVPIAEWDSVTPFETPTESWIDRGMLGQSIDWDTQDLLNALGQQEEEQAGMQSELLGYDPRIVAAMEAGDTDQSALQQLLAGASTPAKTAIKGVAGAAAPKTQTAAGAGKPQAGGLDPKSLLALLGLAQQQQAKEPPPVQMVGEIKPYDFTSDLLAGVYKPNTMSQYQANDQLLKFTRG